MAKRCNVRSFRYSNEVAKILKEYGTQYMSINRKFESLILESWAVLPEMRRRNKAAQDELEELQRQCREWRKRYEYLQTVALQVSEIGRTLSMLQRQLDKLSYDRDV